MNGPWNILWRDEGYFYLQFFVNIQNFMIWATKNSFPHPSGLLHSAKVGCGLEVSFIVGPFFFFSAGLVIYSINVKFCKFSAEPGYSDTSTACMCGSNFLER